MIFGMLGYGRFGKLWATALTPYGEVWVHDLKQLQNFKNSKIKNMSLHQLANVDILFLTLPISEIAKGCQQIKPFLKPSTLIVDCCSVKIYPIQIIQKVLGKQQPLLPTHPLFGPDSVKKNQGLKNLKIVICPPTKRTKKQLQFMVILKKLGLQIIKATAKEHDQQMARSQALVHFIGRGLSLLHLKSQQLATPDFQALINMQQMVDNDSWQLFMDMQKYNPYAKKIRQQFIKQLNSIECKLK